MGSSEDERQTAFVQNLEKTGERHRCSKGKTHACGSFVGCFARFLGLCIGVREDPRRQKRQQTVSGLVGSSHRSSEASSQASRESAPSC
jgi:hypothetical protein